MEQYDALLLVGMHIIYVSIVHILEKPVIVDAMIGNDSQRLSDTKVSFWSMSLFIGIVCVLSASIELMLRIAAAGGFVIV